MPYLEQIPGVAHAGYDPYISQGRRAGETLEAEYGKQLDPATFLSKLQETYTPSAGYQTKKDELMKQLGAVAAAGGYSGTPMAQHQYGTEAERLLSGDMQQYLQNALGIYGQGIAGTQDFYNKGYGASGALTDALAGNLTQQGTLAFTGQQQQNMNRQAMINNFIKALGQGGAAGIGYLGGGWQGAANALGGGRNYGY